MYPKGTTYDIVNCVCYASPKSAIGSKVRWAAQVADSGEKSGKRRPPKMLGSTGIGDANLSALVSCMAKHKRPSFTLPAPVLVYLGWVPLPFRPLS